MAPDQSHLIWMVSYASQRGKMVQLMLYICWQRMKSFLHPYRFRDLFLKKGPVLHFLGKKEVR